jgi:putative peptide zinc metalloprotease protein
MTLSHTSIHSSLTDRDRAHAILCPDLRPYWQLCPGPAPDQVWLRSRSGDHQYPFSTQEAKALQGFVGCYTVAQLQRWCERGRRGRFPRDGVLQLLQRLIDLGVIAPESSSAWMDAAIGSAIPDQTTDESIPTDQPIPAKQPILANQSAPGDQSPFQLKPSVAWVETADGHWILRNLEDMTYMQIPAALRSLLLDLGSMSPGQAAASHGVDLQTVRSLLQQLALTGMLVGTTLPTPSKRKFKPTDLLFYKLTLWNPDRWLSQTFPAIAWIWTRPFALGLAGFLAVFATVGLAQRQSIVHMGMQLWQAMGPGVFLPFGLLSMAVVALHELGHAYTLKRYGGVVPEVGLLFMCLMPAAYTNTTDQYALPRRRQRALVVGAGLLCQGAIAALAWVGWNLSVPGSWLATASYLLLVAALFTVAMNLNPMARFDGYFLLMALTGINNLRSRSFGYYRSLFARQPCREPQSIRWILALYAPLSLLYLLLVFGQLLGWVGQWLVINLPFLTLMALGLWAIYYYLLPTPGEPTST